jgi:hypothetical protein
MFLPKNIIELIMSMDQGIIQDFKVYFHGKLPGDVNSELQITKSLRILTLKALADSVGLARGKLLFPTTSNCWKDNVT